MSHRVRRTGRTGRWTRQRAVVSDPFIGPAAIRQAREQEQQARVDCAAGAVQVMLTTHSSGRRHRAARASLA
jgi:hypothetical protein